MARRLTATICCTLLVAACSTAAPSPQPTEDLPPGPVAPSGWISVAGFGGTAGAGSVTDLSIGLDGRDLALHAACAGSGTLVILASPAGNGFIGPMQSAAFPCGGLGVVADNRFEITRAAIPQTVTLPATVIEAAGTIRHAAFGVSVEQRAP